MESKKTTTGKASDITIVIGVIGADAHAVGNKIIDYALNDAGYHVINLGVMVYEISAMRRVSRGSPSLPVATWW